MYKELWTFRGKISILRVISIINMRERCGRIRARDRARARGRGRDCGGRTRGCVRGSVRGSVREREHCCGRVREHENCCDGLQLC
jgi:hypothetical protein